MVGNRTNTKPVLYKDMEVSHETIVVGIGPHGDGFGGSIFRDCVFEFRTGLQFIASQCQFIRCTFRPLKNLSCGIFDNYWEDCRFIGDFRGTHFGAATDYHDIPTRWPEIALRGCDFSQAKMSWCYLSRLELATTIFPVWPCFTIVNPHQNRSSWIGAELPFPQRIIEYSDVSSTDAIMLNWTAMVKQYKYSPALDPEVVREALSKLDFIRL